ncbi:MAG: acyl-CoA dehydrogenase [Rhodospirillales bacterium 69-11]|nr:acyl-CoA dehydrogenase family protein [Rhodospirillales bacterium]OJW26620.1 MAG: acyl-CoA dehydrogenase [Rhodospirillales bacterium 69-11]
MPMILSEEAQMVRETALEFFRERSPVTALRKLRDDADPTGFSRPLWQQMAELGWTGFLVSEDHGGSGFGVTGLAQVMEAAGRTLTASPLLSTALLGASLLELGGTEAQKAEYLPPLVAGEAVMALALEEAPHHAPTRNATAAKRDGAAWVLEGRKVFVLDGHVADHLVVAARSAGGRDEREGITLFLVPGDAPGVTRTRTIMVDSRNAAIVTLTGVSVGQEAVLGRVDGGADLLDRVLDRARAGLAAEMLGSAQEAFERTVQYLKDRKQFGVAIGSFQALKHRAAQMFCEVEITRSAVMAATAALDEGANDAALLASLAKAKASETFYLCGNEGVQMHGGIGMTDEHEIGFFMKRARVAQATFGDAAFHRDRYAALSGY